MRVQRLGSASIPGRDIVTDAYELSYGGPVTTAPHIMPNTHEFTMSSKHGDEYTVTVVLPMGHQAGGDQRYRVLCAPDGDFFVEALGGLLRLLPIASQAPAPLMGVFVGYGNDVHQEFADTMQRRTKDLTHVDDPEVSQFFEEMLGGLSMKTGGADDLLDFLTEELMPRIEAEYSGSPQRRILFGASMGGEFATYTLLTRPELFEEYFIVSPALGTGDKGLFALEAAYAEAHDDLAATVHYSIGSEEEPAPWAEAGKLGEILRTSLFVDFVSRLEQRGYPSLNLTKRVVNGADHGAMAAWGIAHAVDTLMHADHSVA